jgi:hypothetical protein
MSGDRHRIRGRASPHKRVTAVRRDIDFGERATVSVVVIANEDDGTKELPE